MPSTFNPFRAPVSSPSLRLRSRFAAWNVRGSTSPTKPAAAPKLGVEVADVQIGPMPEVLEATGRILPSATVEIRAQVGGLLKSVLIKDGDRVEVGQPLFEIDDVPLKAALAQLRRSGRRTRRSPTTRSTRRTAFARCPCRSPRPRRTM